jgi:hypothetical protein
MIPSTRARGSRIALSAKIFNLLQKTRAASRAGCLNPAKPRAALSWLMIRLETANALRAADTPVTGRDALTKGVDMDQPAEFLLPILPFLVQVFPTPGKETIAWGGFMIIPRRRGVPGRRSCRVDLRLGCRQGLERGEYRIRREFRIQHARLRGLDLYRNGARNKALARESHRERTVGGPFHFWRGGGRYWRFREVCRQ